MTIEGNHLMLPNALVFESVLLNFSRNSKRRFDFELDLNPGASLHGAMDAGIAALKSLDAVLEEPAPAALIVRILPVGATLQYMGWIDQTSSHRPKTCSEALRRAMKTLQITANAVGEPVQRIRIERWEPEIPQPGEANGGDRDTSVDQALYA